MVRVTFTGRDGTVERVWATRVAPAHYRLENAPALAFGVSLHDVVEIHQDEHGNRWALRVVERGPFFTVRVMLDPVRPRSVRLLKMIEALGCSSERMNAVWFAIFGPNDATFSKLTEQLAAGAYIWEYVNPKREDVVPPHPSAARERLVPPEFDPAAQAVLHRNAPWLDRADDEIEVLATVDVDRDRLELLPARHVDGSWWELCCAPFLADDLALGDVVEVDAALRVRGAVSRSGRGSVLVVVDEGADVATVERGLIALGCIVEPRFRGSRVFAVDCASREVFEAARAWLLRQERVEFDVVREPKPPG